MLRRAPQKAAVYQAVVAWFREEIKGLAAPAPRSRLARVAALRRRGARFWCLLEKLVPTLRLAAPPHVVVAALVALQHTAPLLAVVTAYVMQLQRSGIWPRLSIILIEACLGVDSDELDQMRSGACSSTFEVCNNTRHRGTCVLSDPCDVTEMFHAS